MPAPDQDLIDRIEALAHEEHELFEKESRGEASGAERARLGEIQSQLDESYELLRLRRARRDAGLDPEPPRPASAERSAG
jgi:transposase